MTFEHNPIIYLQNNLYIFRDDLYPFLGGGNKGRKIEYIGKEIESKKCNAVVTTGGIQSNHCRTLAILAALKKWKCILVLHGNRDDFYEQGGNAKIMRLSGAEIVFVDSPEEISSKMDQSMDDLTMQGYSPYYVYGGGHTFAGGLAYIDAIEQMKNYCDQIEWFPDYIFLASGTGSTHAGILAGIDKYKLHTKVIGISVAREKQRAEKIVENFYKGLCEKNNIEFLQNDVVIADDYLCGGYEKYNVHIKELSENSIKKYGFTLDTTYTGKAFYGMLDYMKKNNMNGNVLFWHTGGIFNFLA